MIYRLFTFLFVSLLAFNAIAQNDSKEELIQPLVSHMDVNGLIYSGKDREIMKELNSASTSNLKRIRHYEHHWMEPKSQGLHFISDCTEVKTTWHPIENIGGASSSY